MKRRKSILLGAIPLILMTACLHQTVRTTSTVYDGFALGEVWNAALRTLHDLDFSIYALDNHAGFIGAEGPMPIFHELPPRLSVFISRRYGTVYVDCKVIQPDQLVDVFGYGRKTAHLFYRTLNRNLHRSD